MYGFAKYSNYETVVYSLTINFLIFKMDINSIGVVMKI